MSIFTKEELEQMRMADAEIDASYRITNEEIRASRDRDKYSLFERKDNRQKKIAAKQAAYREVNREKIAAKQAAYREANREKIAAQKAAYYEANREKIAAKQAAYREANREKYNAYHRAYQRKLREAKKNAASR
jgi:hypothetical protein